MKSINKVILCGLGAVGTVYADKLQRFDEKNFRVLVDEERLKRYMANPISFNGNKLNFHYITPDTEDFKADLIIIATKMTGLDDAIKNIKNFIYEDTIIIPLLNGVTSEELIADAYGWDKVLYAYFIGHSSVRTGNTIVHDDVNTFVFGADKEPDERVERVKEFFDRAKINYKVPEDIRHSLWCKYMLNVASNPTTALLRMTFGEMLENKYFMQLAINIMKEVQAVAKAEGVRNTPTMIDETIAHLHTMIPGGKTSMLQDVEAGRHTEIDMFAGTMIELGEKHNIHTPYCSFLKEMFDIIHENQRIHNNNNIVCKIH